MSMQQFLRILSDSINNNSTNTTATGGIDPGDDGTGGLTQQPASEQRDAYEFVAFLAWYLFLVLCCVVPTACAYRRRRLMERRMARQSYLQRMAAQGLVFMEGMEMPSPTMMIDTEENELQRKERMRALKEGLKTTTMKVQTKDLIKKESDDDEEKAADSSLHGVSYSIGDSERDFTHLLLSAGETPNGNRLVPAACAICLCAYENEDSVTYSPHEYCQHCFHTECIVQWLAKKQDGVCPVCRQPFAGDNSVEASAPSEDAPQDSGF